MKTSLSVDDFCLLLKRRNFFADNELEALKKAFHDRSLTSFEYFLMDEGFLHKGDVLQMLSLYYQVPFLDVRAEFFEHRLLHMFDKDVMLRNNFIPYQHDGDVLIVVAANPNDDTLPAILGETVSYDVTFMVGLARDIQDAVKEFYDPSLTEPVPDYPSPETIMADEE